VRRSTCRRAIVIALVILATTACGTRVREVRPASTPTPTASPSATATATPGAWASPVPTTGSPSPSASAAVSATAAATASTSPTAAARREFALVGWWRVTEPAGAGTLGLGEQLVVVHTCGRTVGAWAASPSGLFLAYPQGGDPSCYRQPPRPDVRWLEQGRSYAITRDALVLKGYDGAVVARATRTTPPAGYGEPTVTPALRARLAAPKPLPAAITAATAVSLPDRWEPRGEDAGNGKGYVAFARAGVWTGSDGCNSVGGAYAVGARGELLTLAYPSTLVGCDRTEAPDWVSRARAAGHGKGTLVLYDAKGVFLGRLHAA